METDQQKPSLSAGKGIDGRFEQVLGHVIIERPLGVTHRVLVQSAAALCERAVEKFLGLAAQSPSLDHRKASFELMLLAWNQQSIVLRAEHFAKRHNVSKKCACWLDVLD